MKNARLTAFEILHGVFFDSAYSNLALDSALKDTDSKDKAFVSRLVYGTVERRLTLDYIIAQYLKERTKPKVKTILYLSVYQLYFMDLVPPSAVINEAVKLAGEVGCSYYKGLINAVLHNIDGNRLDLDSIEDLSVKYSCPKSLIDMWTKHYAKENALKILEAINERPPVFAVPNTLFVDTNELAYELLDEGVDCEANGELVIIHSAFDLNKSRAFKNGLFHIEDKSSFECAKALEASEGETVLDLCSAPGGKAFTIAERMNNKGMLYAYDLYEQRAKLIEQGAKRLELKNITVGVNDASAYNPDLPLADKILCDVPCSGFGIIRRKPEIRYKELDSIKELPELQHKILEASSKYLKDGGRLVYSTCTLNKKENERVVSRFIENNESFSLVYDKTVFPSVDGGDGFYYAVIEKKND